MTRKAKLDAFTLSEILRDIVHLRNEKVLRRTKLSQLYSELGRRRNAMRKNWRGGTPISCECGDCKKCKKRAQMRKYRKARREAK